MNKIRAFLQNTSYKRFKKNTLGVVCLGYILIMIAISFFAYIIAPDKTTNANWGDLSIKSKQPGFKVLMLKVPIKNAPEPKLSEYFWGQENRFYKYPIQSFELIDNKIIYIPYNDDPDIKIVKEVTLAD